MGWLVYSQDRSPQTREDEKREIERILTWNGESSTGSCVKALKVGTTWYCAVQAFSKNDEYNSPYLQGLDGSITFAAVVLTSRVGGSWGYKDMTETTGPHETACPRAILDLLSDIDPDLTTYPADYARNWRAACRGHIEADRQKSAAWRNLADGQRVRLAAAITLTNGSVVQEVIACTVRIRGRNTRLFNASGVGLIRLSQSLLADATMLEG